MVSSTNFWVFGMTQPGDHTRTLYSLGQWPGLYSVWTSLNECPDMTLNHLMVRFQFLSLWYDSTWGPYANTLLIRPMARFMLSMNIPERVSWYDTKPSDGEVPVMLEPWGMRSNTLLSSLLGPLWLGVTAPDRVLSMGQIELNSVLMLNWIVWNRTVLTFNCM